MLSRTFVAGICALATAVTVAAQPAPAPDPTQPAQAASAPQRPQPARPAQPAQPPQPASFTPEPPLPERRPGKPVNIRVEVTVSEQIGSKPAQSKSLSLTTADGESAQIRNSPDVATPGPVLSALFAVDAVPHLIDNQRLRLFLNIDYNGVDPAVEKGARNQVRSRQQLVLDSGKPMVVSESADPVTDRRVTVTVTATILR